MTFDIQLHLPASLPPEEHEDIAYDAELDDVRSILRDLCRSLGDVSGVRFSMSVEGPIPVSVRRDLVIVMEQLPDVLAALLEAGTATLDLYEQGIEAQLIFAIDGEKMSIERRDLSSRNSPTCKVKVPCEVAMESLRSLARTFVDATRRRSRERTSHPWFEDWAQSLLARARS